MTLLLQALARLLEEGLGEVRLEKAGRAAPVCPRIFLGALPPKRPQEREDELFPFIIVRWSGGTDQDGEAVDSVELILGVYAADGPQEAEQWTTALAGSIRTLLLLPEHRVLEGRFELQPPIRSAKADPKEQQERYHLATITTSWRWNAPEQTLEV